MRDRPGPAAQDRRRWIKLPKHTVRIVALLGAVLIVIVAFVLQLQVSEMEEVAYPAIFLISLVGNATLILPAPAIISVCSAGTSLNPVIVGLVAGTGQALGEITGYLAGFSGSGLARNTRIFQRVQPWMLRRGWIALFVFAFVPNPLFDIAGLAAGAMRMPVWKFLLATWAGKTVRSVLLAYGCSLGYDFFFAG